MMTLFGNFEHDYRKDPFLFHPIIESRHFSNPHPDEERGGHPVSVAITILDSLDLWVTK